MKRRIRCCRVLSSEPTATSASKISALPKCSSCTKYTWDFCSLCKRIWNKNTFLWFTQFSSKLLDYRKSIWGARRESDSMPDLPHAFPHEGQSRQAPQRSPRHSGSLLNDFFCSNVTFFFFLIFFEKNNRLVSARDVHLQSLWTRFQGFIFIFIFSLKMRIFQGRRSLHTHMSRHRSEHGGLRRSNRY